MCLFKYQTAGPYEILLISRAGNKKIKLKRKSLIWPSQTCMTLNIGLTTCNFEVKCTSSEKLSFLVPTSFAIGPWTQDMRSMLKYAKFVSPGKCFPYEDVKKFLADTIKREMRTFAASMTHEEISKATKELRDIVDKSQLILSKFGLFIYFAYINNGLVYTREHMEAIGISRIKEEDDKRYAKEQDANASLQTWRKSADASLYEKQKAADGLVYAKEKEAQGTKAVEEAQRLNTATLLKAFGGNYDYVRSYLKQD